MTLLGSSSNLTSPLVGQGTEQYGSINGDKKNTLVVADIWERHLFLDDFKKQYQSKKPTLQGRNFSYWGPLSSHQLPHGVGLKHYTNETDASYFGLFLNGLRSGQGYFMVPSSDQQIYEGQWENDQKSGQGTQQNSDGSIFCGTFVEGKYHEGTLTYNDGSFFKGKWDDAGFFFEGTFVDGSRTVRYEGGQKQATSGCCVLL